MTQDPRHRGLGEQHAGPFSKTALTLRHVKKQGLSQSPYLACQKMVLVAIRPRHGKQECSSIGLRNMCFPKDTNTLFICQMVIRSAINAQRLHCSLQWFSISTVRYSKQRYEKLSCPIVIQQPLGSQVPDTVGSTDMSSWEVHRTCRRSLQPTNQLTTINISNQTVSSRLN